MIPHLIYSAETITDANSSIQAQREQFDPPRNRIRSIQRCPQGYTSPLPFRTNTCPRDKIAVYGREASWVSGNRRLTGHIHDADLSGSWYQPSGSGASSIKYEEEFLRHTWDFHTSGKRSSETLPAGNYEYPFDMILPGSTPESVEGLTETWLVYRMKATIERGMLQQNSVARKQVRVIRTLDTGALELAHAMVSQWNRQRVLN